MSEIPGRPLAGFCHSGSSGGSDHRPRDEDRQDPLRVAMLYPEALMNSERWYRRTIRPGSWGFRVKHRHPAGSFFIGLGSSRVAVQSGTT
jgi:hypothetical protein